MIFSRGQRWLTKWASRIPSIAPGICTSVNMMRTSARCSKVVSASPASQASRTLWPESWSTIIVLQRNSSSSSTTSTTGHLRVFELHPVRLPYPLPDCARAGFPREPRGPARAYWSAPQRRNESSRCHSYSSSAHSDPEAGHPRPNLRVRPSSLCRCLGNLCFDPCGTCLGERVIHAGGRHIFHEFADDVSP